MVHVIQVTELVGTTVVAHYDSNREAATDLRADGWEQTCPGIWVTAGRPRSYRQIRPGRAD